MIGFTDDGATTGQMVRLVDDLLDVSRITRSKIDLKKGRVELASSIHHAAEAVRPMVENMNHELDTILPSHSIYLDADPTRLAQVIGNLLTNACKFTNSGGKISLSAERDGKEAVIRVRDNGIGIAADKLPRIFDMFMQVDTSLERTVSGLGIGLTLVKNLVELHGGTIGVKSGGLNQGTEFEVRLPVAETAELCAAEDGHTAPVRITSPNSCRRRQSGCCYIPFSITETCRSRCGSRSRWA